jgi:hypothetical protein
MDRAVIADASICICEVLEFAHKTWTDRLKIFMFGVIS